MDRRRAGIFRRSVPWTTGTPPPGVVLLLEGHLSRGLVSTEPGRAALCPALEQRVLAFDPAHGVVVQNYAADAAVFGQGPGLRADCLRGEYSYNRT